VKPSSEMTWIILNTIGHVTYVTKLLLLLILSHLVRCNVFLPKLQTVKRLSFTSQKNSNLNFAQGELISFQHAPSTLFFHLCQQIPDTPALPVQFYAPIIYLTFCVNASLTFCATKRQSVVSFREVPVCFTSVRLSKSRIGNLLLRCCVRHFSFSKVSLFGFDKTGI